MTMLAVALAREAFFGEEVVAQCSAKGYGGKPGLPHKEMMLLKEEVLRLYPNYLNSPHMFEEKWNKCSEQISQACNRIRAKRRKHSTLSQVQTVVLSDCILLLVHVNEITYNNYDNFG